METDGIATDRREAIDGDRGDYGLRRVRVERKPGHLADPNAIEQDRGADQKSGHGALELT